MEKVVFTGTVETFYFVPIYEQEKAVIYLNVSTQKKYPNGREERLIPPVRMRFELQEHEIGILTKGTTIALGDEMSICAAEDDQDELSYRIDSIKQKKPITDAKDYVLHLKD